MKKTALALLLLFAMAGVPAKIVREHTKAGWQPARGKPPQLPMTF